MRAAESREWKEMRRENVRGRTKEPNLDLSGKVLRDTTTTVSNEILFKWNNNYTPQRLESRGRKEKRRENVRSQNDDLLVKSSMMTSTIFSNQISLKVNKIYTRSLESWGRREKRRENVTSQKQRRTSIWVVKSWRRPLRRSFCFIFWYSVSQCARTWIWSRMTTQALSRVDVRDSAISSRQRPSVLSENDSRRKG